MEIYLYIYLFILYNPDTIEKTVQEDHETWVFIYVLALIWLKALDSESSPPWTGCQIIILLLHCVQHLLISIMGYAPMHQANPGR